MMTLRVTSYSHSAAVVLEDLCESKGKMVIKLFYINLFFTLYNLSRFTEYSLNPPLVTNFAHVRRDESFLQSVYRGK